MAPAKESLFDFDCLDELEASPGNGPHERSRDAARALEELREECERAGLSAGWCVDADTLRALLARSSEWERYGICALVDECWKTGVQKPEVNPQRDEVLWRLRCSLVWNALALSQLEEECERRGIPFYPVRWWRTLRMGPLGLDYTDLDCVEKEAKADLVRRLVQDSWAEERGPLRREGIPGLWSPRFRSGHERLPAWTGSALEGVRSPPVTRAAEVQLRRQPRPPPRWRNGPLLRSDEFKDAGPRVCWFYMHFPWFCGDVPGQEAEFAWTDEELEAYFSSDGKVQPKPREPKAPPEGEPRPQNDERARAGQHDEQDSQRQRQQQQRQRQQGGSQQGQEKGAKDREQPKQQGERWDQYYRTLGLQPGAAADEVRRTYRKLVLLHHPDKAPGQQDASMFRQIQEAYEILGAHKA